MPSGRKHVFRVDGREEILCSHGVGHTTYSSAVTMALLHREPQYSYESNVKAWLTHGCDGCCKQFPECRAPVKKKG